MGDIVAGQGGTVTVGSAIADVKRWSISPKIDDKDITTLSSEGWRDFKGVLKSWDVDFDVISFPGDIVGSTLAGTFVTSSETGSKTYAGSVLVLSIAPDIPFDDIVGYKVSCRGRKALTIT